MDLISRSEIESWLLNYFWPYCVALNIIVYSLEADPSIPWGGGGKLVNYFYYLPDQKQTIFFLR